MKACLLETGPIVAFIDCTDPAHNRVVEIMRGLRAKLVTTGAVATEAFHLLSESADGPASSPNSFAAGNVDFLDVFESDTLEQIVRL